VKAIIKARLEHSDGIELRNVDVGTAVLFVNDDTGLHMYSLEADDPAIASLDKTLENELLT